MSQEALNASYKLHPKASFYKVCLFMHFHPSTDLVKVRTVKAEENKLATETFNIY